MRFRARSPLAAVSQSKPSAASSFCATSRLTGLSSTSSRRGSVRMALTMAGSGADAACPATAGAALGGVACGTPGEPMTGAAGDGSRTGSGKISCIVGSRSEASCSGAAPVRAARRSASGDCRDSCVLRGCSSAGTASSPYSHTSRSASGEGRRAIARCSARAVLRMPLMSASTAR